MRILETGWRAAAIAMCDYSLQNVASRSAKVGDKLVTTQFPGTITRGFASTGEPGVAVCLLPGSEIAFEKDVGWRSSTFGPVFKSRHVGAKVARFLEINIDKPNVHHDALDFPTGETLVANLSEGQHATDLQLPAQPKTPSEAEPERPVTYVG